MKAFTLTAGVLLAAAPLAAQQAPERTPEQKDVAAATDAFFQAIGSTRKTDLAEVMLPEGVIFIHDRMTPGAPKLHVVPVAQHLERWAKNPNRNFENMRYETILISGDMAQVWGPYVFVVNSVPSHCGVNSLSLVRRDGVWKVANTSFTMEPVSQCAEIGAPGFEENVQ